jgi:uncharacterized protein DUF1168
VRKRADTRGQVIQSPTGPVDAPCTAWVSYTVLYFTCFLCVTALHYTAVDSVVNVLRYELVCSGSSAGANSGSFHRYAKDRRREMFRQKRLEAEAKVHAD